MFDTPLKEAANDNKATKNLPKDKQIDRYNACEEEKTELTLKIEEDTKPTFKRDDIKEIESSKKQTLIKDKIIKKSTIRHKDDFKEDDVAIGMKDDVSKTHKKTLKSQRANTMAPDDFEVTGLLCEIDFDTSNVAAEVIEDTNASTTSQIVMQQGCLPSEEQIAPLEYKDSSVKAKFKQSRESIQSKATKNVRSEVIDSEELEAKPITVIYQPNTKEASKSKHKLNRELTIIESPIQEEALITDDRATIDVIEQQQLEDRAKLTKKEVRKLSRALLIPRLEALDVTEDKADRTVVNTPDILKHKQSVTKSKQVEKAKSNPRNVGVLCADEKINELEDLDVKKDKATQKVESKTANQKVQSMGITQAFGDKEEVSSIFQNKDVIGNIAGQAECSKAKVKPRVTKNEALVGEFIALEEYIDMPDSNIRNITGTKSFEDTNKNIAIKSTEVIGHHKNNEELGVLDNSNINIILPIVKDEENLESKEESKVTVDETITNLANPQPMDQRARLSKEPRDIHLPINKSIEMNVDITKDETIYLEVDKDKNIQATIKKGIKMKKPESNEIQMMAAEVAEGLIKEHESISGEKKANSTTEKRKLSQRVISSEKLIGVDNIDQNAEDFTTEQINNQRASTIQVKKECKNRSKSTERIEGHSIIEETAKDLKDTKNQCIRANETQEPKTTHIAFKTSHVFGELDSIDSTNTLQSSDTEIKAKPTEEKGKPTERVTSSTKLVGVDNNEQKADNFQTDENHHQKASSSMIKGDQKHRTKSIERIQGFGIVGETANELTVSKDPSFKAKLSNEQKTKIIASKKSYSFGEKEKTDSANTFESVDAEQRSKESKTIPKMKDVAVNKVITIVDDSKDEKTEELKLPKETDESKQTKEKKKLQNIAAKKSISIGLSGSDESTEEIASNKQELKFAKSKSSYGTKHIASKKDLVLGQEDKNESINPLDCKILKKTAKLKNEGKTNKDNLVLNEPKSIGLGDFVEATNEIAPTKLEWKLANPEANFEIKPIASKTSLQLGQGDENENVSPLDCNVSKKKVKVNKEISRMKDNAVKVDKNVGECLDDFNESIDDMKYEPMELQATTTSTERRIQAFNVPQTIGVRLRCKLMY